MSDISPIITSIISPIVSSVIGDSVFPLLDLPLKSTLIPHRARGSSTPTFTRATTATVIDQEGIVRSVLSGEARFAGARRVENKIAVSSEDFSVWTTAGTASVTGTNILNFPAVSDEIRANFGSELNGDTHLASVKLSGTGQISLIIRNYSVGGANSVTRVTLTSTPTRYFVKRISGASGLVRMGIQRTDGADTATEVTANFAMGEDSTGRTDTETPSEYVSSGVGTGVELISSPITASDWDGSGANTVTNNGTGAVIITYVDNNLGAVLDLGALYPEIELSTSKQWVLTYTAVGVTGGIAVRLNGETPSYSNSLTQGETYSALFSYSSGSLTMDMSGTMGIGEVLTISIDSLKQADHGSNVDSVKAFSTNNGNSVSSNVVTEATGTAINLLNNPKSVTLDGISGSFVGTPDSVKASVISDITLIGYADADNWTPAGIMVLIGKRTGSTSSYGLRIDTSGFISLITSVDGLAFVVSASTVATGFTDTAGGWIRATWDDSGNVSNFYISNEPKFTEPSIVEWGDPLGDADVAHVSSGIFDGTALVEIGSQSTGTAAFWTGLVSKAVVIASTDPTATPSLSFNASDHINNATTLTSSNTGEVYTLNGGATIPNYYYNANGPFGYRHEASKDVLGYPSSLNILPSYGSIRIDWIPAATGQGTVFVCGSYVDANNYTAILHDGTNIIFRKRVSGSNHDATKALSYSADTSYTIVATYGSSDSEIYVDGAQGTGNTNTANLQLGASFQIGTDGNGANQSNASSRLVKIYGRQLSAAKVAAI